MRAALFTLVGAVLVAGGRAVGLLQEIVPALRAGRPSAEQQRVLREVFDDAAPAVRIVAGLRAAGVFGLSRRAVTLARTIYLKGDTRHALLVHEAVHVWQYRRLGVRYAADAVLAQNVGHGYDWRAAVADGATRWLDLNLEAQAQFLQDLYDGGRGDGTVGHGAYFRAYDAGTERDFPGYRALAEDALRTLRGT